MVSHVRQFLALHAPVLKTLKEHAKHVLSNQVIDRKCVLID